jgi:2-hydroxy-6-oxonona-2,4-dienedioate hydrolase
MSPVLRGLAAAPGVAAGPVVVLEANGDFASVVRGSVVVARLLSPRHAPLFGLAAGVVVEEGGLLQHATALAREFVIPAVVGVRDATTELRPGQWVRVDGGTGEVELAAGDEGPSDENERLETAERNLFALYGLEPETVAIALPAVGVGSRVLVAGEGPPLLLLHGGSGSAAQWAPLMASLQGHTMYAIDRPGSGTGDFFDYTGVDLRAHAIGFLESVFDALDIPAAPVVANSVGGLWSFWFAFDRPERIDAVVQLGCPAFLLGTRVPLAMRFASIGLVERSDRRRHARALLRHVAGGRGLERAPEQFVEWLYAAELRRAHVRTRAGYLRELARMHREQPEMGLGPEFLANVRQPVLFVWGTDDWYGAPSVGERACRQLPSAWLEVLPAGHLPWLDEPMRCADAIDRFLVRVSAEGPAHAGGALRP